MNAMTGSPASTGSTTELPRSYTPSDHEAVITRKWLDSGAFSARADDGRPAYSIMIPPPNVTAALHLGHALNNTLQDILVRYHRMRGFNTLWMPGTDHAGIATQAVVEKRLIANGSKRTDYSRDEFISLVQEWKDEYEATIIDQLHAMGASCDWNRTRFTMDPVCATAVREAFFRLFSDRLIYRGKRLVNWDPATQTALADDEVEMQEVPGHMWYLQYPLDDGSGSITVATTRPETMLGDTAVAMNPADPRAEKLRGRQVRLPIVNRLIPIVEDDYVVMPVSEGQEATDPKAEYATGFLKVTPAHDPNDWEIGRRHDLQVINVMAPDGSISDRHGWDDATEEASAFIGLSREDARTSIVQWFSDNDLLEEVREYSHSVGHSYRSHVPIEPYLSDQWFVKVTDDRLGGSALRSLDSDQYEGEPPLREGGPLVGDGELEFFPARYARTFQNWHESIRDWCISRQLWWGHRIPVWSRAIESDGNDVAAQAVEGHEDNELVPIQSDWTASGLAHAIRRSGDGMLEEYICMPVESALVQAGTYASEPEAVEALESAGFRQDPDVLDTWFSSALWPLSTLGWPDPDRWDGMNGLLETFNPSTVLSTGREIITLWVSRMVMFNRYFRDGLLPFREVFIHLIIQDGAGQKMSKSLGNGVDPRDIIHTHGADALRFVLAQMSTNTQDARLPVDLVCPFTGEVFEPKMTRTSQGYLVPEPVQASPADPSKKMATLYGMVSGLAEPSGELPLAKNTSSRFDAGRNFANKLWNACRFALGSLEKSDPDAGGELTIIDRWIISRLAGSLATIQRHIDMYEFHICSEVIYDFVWRDFCDWYLEGIKPTVGSNSAQQRMLAGIINATLRLVHPFCPFVTEALWPHVDAVTPELPGLPLERSEMLINAHWPVPDMDLHDPEIESEFGRVKELVGVIRNMRSQNNVPPKARLVLHADSETTELIRQAGGVVQTMAGLSDVQDLDDAQEAIPIGFEGRTLMLGGLVGQVDIASEKNRLDKLIQEKQKAVTGFTNKLSNKGYVDNAPDALVEQTRQLLAQAEADLEAARTSLGVLEGGA
ncbi:MAG: valine--tRNA ligase [Phycisphaerae bacterium]|nr:valine--tRNA ligase [Phycisphaerae bacterium]